MKGVPEDIMSISCLSSSDAIKQRFVYVNKTNFKQGFNYFKGNRSSFTFTPGCLPGLIFRLTVKRKQVARETHQSTAQSHKHNMAARSQLTTFPESVRGARCDVSAAAVSQTKTVSQSVRASLPHNIT